MSLSDIAQVTITTQTGGITQAGFGTPLVVGNESALAPLWAKVYSVSTALADMVSDGFATTDASYLAVQAIAAQSPRPTQVVVGRREAPPTMVRTLTPILGATDDVFTVTLNGTEATYTQQAGDTVADIIDGLVTALGSPTDITLTDNTTDLDIEADNAGDVFTLSVSGNIDVDSDDETDGNFADDMVNIVDANDDWYALVSTSRSEATALEIAAWIETREKIAGIGTNEAGIIDSTVSDDFASTMQTASRARTFVFHTPQPDQYPEAAWLGRVLPTLPGSPTFKFKTLSGVNASGYTTAQRGTLDDKGVNYAYNVGGRVMTAEGVMAGGEFVDVIRGRDWIKARIQEDIVLQLLNTDKIPFTDAGGALIEQVIRKRLDEAVRRDIIVEGYNVTVPLVSTISAANKASRTFAGIEFEATLAGAIHSLTISGTIGV